MLHVMRSRRYEKYKAKRQREEDVKVTNTYVYRWRSHGESTKDSSRLDSILSIFFVRDSGYSKVSAMYSQQRSEKRGGDASGELDVGGGLNERLRGPDDAGTHADR